MRTDRWTTIIYESLTGCSTLQFINHPLLLFPPDLPNSSKKESLYFSHFPTEKTLAQKWPCLESSGWSETVRCLSLVPAWSGEWGLAGWSHRSGEALF